MYNVYTDGGCRGNPGIGAWAFVVYNAHGKELGSKSGSSDHTTNNAMELEALVRALDWFSRSNQTEINIYTDSAYCCNGWNQWLDNWKRNMWRSSNKGSIKNLALWKQVWELRYDLRKAGRTITIHKVKGHSGNTGNDRADQLCNLAMDELEFEQRMNSM